MTADSDRVVGQHSRICLTINTEEVCDGQTGRSGGVRGDPLLGVDDGRHVAVAAGTTPAAHQREHGWEVGGAGGRSWNQR
jgi:hypothetical protein